MSETDAVVLHPRRCSLDGLPAELLLNIVDRLDILDFPSLICATFPLLRYHGIVPPTSSQELSAMMRAASHGRFKPQATNQNQSSPLGIGVLPPELRLHMSPYLTTAEKINFAIATWRLFNVVHES